VPERNARPEAAPRELVMERIEKERAEVAKILHVIAFSIENMAAAMEEDDEILGVLAGRGIAENLPLLPRHVREVFIENLTDEAAAGARSERLYYEYVEAQAAAR